MLHVIYVSFHCSEKMFERIFRDSKQKPGQAVQKYNRLMAEGFAKQKDCSVTVVTVFLHVYFFSKRRKMQSLQMHPNTFFLIEIAHIEQQ